MGIGSGTGQELYPTSVVTMTGEVMRYIGGMHNRLALGLILLAIAGRLIPHPDNFTPVAAVALFAGAVLPGWRAIVVIVAALLLSDLLHGFSPNMLSVGVYGAFLAGVGVGRLINSRPSWPLLGTAVVANAFGFFIISNFVVWALPHGLTEVNYSHTLDGLMECYAAALPFLRNAAAGDVFWTVLLFGLYGFGRERLAAHAVGYKPI